MLSPWILFPIGGYLLGSIPFGKFLARLVARIDITERGSRNIGATNVARELGIKWGLITLVLDLLKGLVPVVLFQLLASDSQSGHDLWLAAVALSPLLGHQFSIFMGLRGGKGVSTALGVYLGISPLACAGAIVLFLIVTYLWDFVSLGSMVAACSLPGLLLLMGKPHPVVIGALVAALLICIKHRENIQRLIKGKERKWREGRAQARRSNSLSNSSSE
jgi:glycerol-3-phosphate acyltransferase PlsY